MGTFLTRLFVIAAAALLLAPLATAAEDLRIRQLENEVMRLQRQLDAQSRRIEELERSVRNSGAAGANRPLASATRPADSSPAWLVNSNWDRLRPGMTELEVIAVLGRPTSVRTDADGKVRALFYALELGPDAVLAGNVRMGDAGVADISRPTLK